MKWKEVKPFLQKKGVKLTLSLLCAGAAGAGISSYYTYGSYVPSRQERDFLYNDARNPEEEHIADDQADQENGQNVWEKSEDGTEQEIPQRGDGTGLFFNEIRQTERLGASDMLLGMEGQEAEQKSSGAKKGEQNAAAGSRLVFDEEGDKKNSLVIRTDPDTVQGRDGKRTGTGSAAGTGSGSDAQEHSGTNTSGNVIIPVDKDARYTVKVPDQHPKKTDYMDSFSDKNVGGLTDTEDYRFYLSVIPSDPKKWVDPMMSFCVGDEITDQELLYAFDVQLFAMDKNNPWETSNYLVDQAGESVRNERIVDEENPKDITIKFSVKVNGQWIEGDEQELHLYDQRIIYADEQGTPLWTEYVDNGDLCRLNAIDSYPFWQKESPLYETITLEDGEQQVKRLLQGWSETPGGELLDPAMEIHCDENSAKLKVLYAKSVEIPDTWKVTTGGKLINYEYLIDWPLLAETEEEEIVDLPEGIKEICGTVHADQLRIPSSVEKIDLKDAVIRKSFVVDPENEQFEVQENGYLTGKENHALYGVPADQKEVVIPEDIEELNLRFGEDQKVIFRSAQPPVFDLSAGSVYRGEAEYVVPGDHYVDYLRIWTPDAEAQKKIRPDREGMDLDGIYVDVDGSVVQDTPEGKKLLSVPGTPDMATVYVVPNDIVEIAAGAIPADCTLGELVIPASVKKIDASVLDMQNVTSVYLLHDQDEIPVLAHTDQVENYTYINVNDETVKEKLSIPEEKKDMVSLNAGTLLLYHGNVYDAQEDGVVSLRRADPKAEKFDEQDIPEGYVLQNIYEGAFSNCKDLQIVILPESTSMILPRAFEGCEKLEGIFAQGKEMLYLFGPSFTGCDKLKFFASNAAELMVSEEEDQFIKFTQKDKLMDVECLYGSAGYDGMFGYELEQQGDGYILYQYYLDEEGNEDPMMPKTLMAATSEVSGEISLNGATVIARCAFADCANPFTIREEDWNQVEQIVQGAFIGSIGFRGITGDDEETGTVVLTENMWNLGDSAFYGCPGIRKVIIDVPDVPAYTFLNCGNLEEVVFRNEEVSGIGAWAFVGTGIHKMTLPSEVSYIGQEAFDGLMEILDITGDLPPILGEVMADHKNLLDRYYFKNGEKNDLRILLKGQNAADLPELSAAFLKQWKYNLLGYTDYDSMYDGVFFATYLSQNVEHLQKLRELYGDQLEKEPESLREEVEMLCKALIADETAKSEKLVKQLLGLPEDWIAPEIEEEPVDKFEDPWENEDPGTYDPWRDPWREELHTEPADEEELPAEASEEETSAEGSDEDVKASEEEAGAAEGEVPEVQPAVPEEKREEAPAAEIPAPENTPEIRTEEGAADGE